MEVAKPYPAATVVLLRDGPHGMEVFMVRRHHQIDFAGGALVFPGGKVAPDDERLAGKWVPDDPLAAFRVAAIRELFEESGLLLARSGAAGNGEADASIDRLRTELMQARVSFEELLGEIGAVLELDALLPFAHWITPEMMPKRFDTHFFLARMRGDARLRHDGGETVDSLWITPDEAIAAARDGRHTIIWPTLMNLQKLACHATIDDLWAATGSVPVVTVLPRLVDTPQGKRMCIPPEAGYAHWAVDLGQLMGR